MREVPISGFKIKCSALLEKVRRTRQPIRITRNGEPIAGIVPTPPIIDRKSMIGSMRDSCEIIGDIISPANDEDEWEVLRVGGEESTRMGTNKLTSLKVGNVIDSTRVQKSKR